MRVVVDRLGDPTSAAGRKLRAVVREQLAGVADDLAFLDDGTPMADAVDDADGIVTLLSTRVDDALLDRAPRLKAVGNFAVGYDNVDLEACKARGVAVCNTPDVLTRATAELSLTLLLAAARRVPEGETMARAGAFAGWAPDMLLGRELFGRRAVIVGRGRIGEATGALFAAVGLEVAYITRSDDERAIDDKLARAQVLSLHVPLSEATRHWLDARRLALLPADAIVINTARGPVVDEAALIDVLRERRIFAAGLDVYEREPEIPKALRSLDNAVLLPHLGSATYRAREGMARLSSGGVAAVLRGEDPPNRLV